MTRATTGLPARPNLVYLKKLAKRRLASLRASLPAAKLADAQLAVAREHGFSSWRALRKALDTGGDGSAVRSPVLAEAIDAFLDAAVPRPNDNHRGGDLAAAEELLAANPQLPAADALVAAALGDDDALARLLAEDRRRATTAGGPRGWPPLLYLCFSRYLRLRRRLSPKFVRAARLLLEHGADVNSHFVADPANPRTIGTALYGAAGVAGSAPLTQLLLDAGADVDDTAPPGTDGTESLYHACEHKSNACLRLLLSRNPRPTNVAYCLFRKLDFEDVAGVKLFLDHGADVNYRAGGGVSEGKTCLHHAILRGRSARIIELLLKAGSDPNARDRSGTTPYQLARRLGHVAVAKLLVKHGADDTLSETDRFLAACATANRRAARQMLRHNPRLVAELGPDRQRALPAAAAAGKLAAVRLMLDLGFDIDAPGDWGGSALHQAAWGGHVELVKLLLARGASPLAQNQYGGNALGCAIHAGNYASGNKHGPEIVRLIAPTVPPDVQQRLLTFAQSLPNRAIAQALKEVMSTAAGGNGRSAAAVKPAAAKRAPTRSGGDWKPLHDASFAGDAVKVKSLLEARADPNALGATGHRYRPLHRAIEPKKLTPKHDGHEQVVRLLLEHGADPHLRGTYGRVTALQLAATGEWRFVPILLPHFQPLDIFHAAAVGDADRVAALLKEDPKRAAARDENDWTPLHYCGASSAYKLGRAQAEALVRIATLLLKHGADPAATYKWNDTWPMPVLYTCCGYQNNPAIAKVLLEAGASPCDGETVYHAAEQNHVECLALIERHTPPKDLAAECSKAMPSMLHWGFTRALPWLLAHGGDPNFSGQRWGNSALHEAVLRKSNDRVIRMLLDHGGDPAVKNRDGKTAVDLARASSASARLLPLLAKKGGRP